MTARPTAKGRLVLVGLVCGLAWGSALRAWMTLVAFAEGEPPTYDWELTFLVVLLPPTLIGGIYGWATWARRHHGSSRWRYSGWTPLVFIIVPILHDPRFVAPSSTVAWGRGR